LLHVLAQPTAGFPTGHALIPHGESRTRFTTESAGNRHVLWAALGRNPSVIPRGSRKRMSSGGLGGLSGMVWGGRSVATGIMEQQANDGSGLTSNDGKSAASAPTTTAAALRLPGAARRHRARRLPLLASGSCWYQPESWSQ